MDSLVTGQDPHHNNVKENSSPNTNSEVAAAAPRCFNSPVSQLHPHTQPTNNTAPSPHMVSCPFSTPPRTNTLSHVNRQPPPRPIKTPASQTKPADLYPRNNNPIPPASAYKSTQYPPSAQKQPYDPANQIHAVINSSNNNNNNNSSRDVYSPQQEPEQPWMTPPTKLALDSKPHDGSDLDFLLATPLKTAQKNPVDSDEDSLHHNSRFHYHRQQDSDHSHPDTNHPAHQSSSWFDSSNMMPEINSDRSDQAISPRHPASPSSHKKQCRRKLSSASQSKKRKKLTTSYFTQKVYNTRSRKRSTIDDAADGDFEHTSSGTQPRRSVPTLAPAPTPIPGPSSPSPSHSYRPPNVSDSTSPSRLINNQHSKRSCSVTGSEGAGPSVIPASTVKPTAQALDPIEASTSALALDSEYKSLPSKHLNYYRRTSRTPVRLFTDPADTSKKMSQHYVTDGPLGNTDLTTDNSSQAFAPKSARDFASSSKSLLRTPLISPSNYNPFSPAIQNSNYSQSCKMPAESLHFKLPTDPRTHPPVNPSRGSAATFAYLISAHISNASSSTSRQPQPQPQSQTQPQPWSEISRYRQEFEEIEEIGSGHYGQVFKCKKRVDGWIYAIKCTKGALWGKAKERNLQEVYAHAALSDCTHVIRYYNSWFEEDIGGGQYLYIQTEDIPGGSLLKRWLNKEFQLKDDHLIQFLLQNAKGLNEFHRRSLVHLDIKPENLYRDENGVYKIGDLGHTTFSEDFGPERKWIVELKEGDGHYIPQEFLQGNHEHLTKADIYALGLSAYQLAQSPDFQVPSNWEMWYESIEKRRKNKTEPVLGDEIFDVILQMIDPDPQKRPSASKLVSMLEMLLVSQLKENADDIQKLKALVIELNQQLEIERRDNETLRMASRRGALSPS